MGGLTEGKVPDGSVTTAVRQTPRRRSGVPRAPLSLALSCDGGLIWPLRSDLVTGDGHCLTNNSRDGLDRALSNPSMAQTPDGLPHRLHLYRRDAPSALTAGAVMVSTVAPSPLSLDESWSGPLSFPKGGHASISDHPVPPGPATAPPGSSNDRGKEPYRPRRSRARTGLYPEGNGQEPHEPSDPASYGNAESGQPDRALLRPIQVGNLTGLTLTVTAHRCRRRAGCRRRRRR